MNISYKWLKEYINTNLKPEELEDILTQTGLEVGGITEVESVKGGLRGLVIGEVLTCEPHENSDHLHKTTVNLGDNKETPIVCGAPNVAAGQKVIVATVGTTLYSGDDEFKIKKSKIRGEVSEGMICAEDEIGLGKSHDGILVLPNGAIVGTPASEYFNIESDYQIEIDLTPNRIDGASHIGVARDLAAFLSKEEPTPYTKPSVDAFNVDNTELNISVNIEAQEACQRYAGLSISNVKVAPSPDWLQNRLTTIGLTPINNIVDITNYVLFETGQPLHAFDAQEITGNKIIVKKVNSDTAFTTLDGQEIKLNEEDLMICNEKEPMCIAGIFGGIKSGIKDGTTNVFLESARFEPVHVRKTARRHGLNTDSSFRFERGTDPNMVIYALKRAALLIKEIAGGEISSNIIDIYPKVINAHQVTLNLDNATRLIGKKLDTNLIKRILTALEIEILSETNNELNLAIPPYRVDITREADVIEEILRIYGYNNVEIPTKVNASLQYSKKNEPNKIRKAIASLLSAQGFNEIWSNSLTKSSYYENENTFNKDQEVSLFNPLSNDLNTMRRSLIFGGLECIAYNTNRKNGNLRLFEFGNCYFKNNEENNSEKPILKYHEEEHLALFVAGNKEQENWISGKSESSFFQLKAYAEGVLASHGLTNNKLKTEAFSNELISEGLKICTQNNSLVAEIGILSKKLLKEFSINSPVYYADIRMEAIYKFKNKTQFSELPKYPEVRRDLALLIDKHVTFNQIVEIAQKSERKLLRKVDLFDIYEGKGIPDGKKSYAVSFIIRDDEKTLNDKQIDKIMSKLVSNFEQEIGAQLR